MKNISEDWLVTHKKLTALIDAKNKVIKKLKAEIRGLHKGVARQSLMNIHLRGVIADYKKAYPDPVPMMFSDYKK